LAGVTVPSGLDGISFVPATRGQADQQKPHAYLYWEFYERGSAQAVRMGKWKGMCKPFGGPIELYDLKTDIGEQHDIAAQHPEVVAKVREAMKAAHTPSPQWQVTPAKKKG